MNQHLKTYLAQKFNENENSPQNSKIFEPNRFGLKLPIYIDIVLITLFLIIVITIILQDYLRYKQTLFIIIIIALFYGIRTYISTLYYNNPKNLLLNCNSIFIPKEVSNKPTDMTIDLSSIQEIKSYYIILNDGKNITNPLRRTRMVFYPNIKIFTQNQSIKIISAIDNEKLTKEFEANGFKIDYENILFRYFLYIVLIISIFFIIVIFDGIKILLN